MLLEVAVAAPLYQTLTYSLPGDPGNCPEELIGRRVIVPLGGRRVTGYILAIQQAGDKPSFRIRNIQRLADNHSLFQPDVIPFFKWIANYYHHPIGLVIQTAMPTGLSPRSRKQLILINADQLTAELGQESQSDDSWAQELLEKRYFSPSATDKLLGDRKAGRILRRLIKQQIVEVRQIDQQDGVKNKLESCCAASENVRQHITSSAEISDYKNLRNHLSAELGIDLKLSEARALYVINEMTCAGNGPVVPLRDVRARYSGISKALPGLEEKNLVVRSEQRVYRSPTGQQLPYYASPEKLTAEQDHVLDKILPVIQERRYQPILLHGVTGCGKTEIYLRAAEKTLAEGRDVLILVPEIALATQTEAHFVSRFADKVVVLHSGLSVAERFDQFSLARTGQAKVVIGARSAVFAPLKDPGLIVVDEEHDGAYKQEDNFRYNGRDIAILRARHHKSVVLLGSATPSVISYANAVNGKYMLLEMKARVSGRALPQVRVVDLNLKDKYSGPSIIGEELQVALQKNLERGKQSILLMNRRGFSTVMLCKDCGTVAQCDHCHVSLTLHKQRNRLLCHYCGFSIKAATLCSQCRSTELVPVGFGTERVEEVVGEILPDAKIRRIDGDIAADRKKFLSILSEMQRGEIDILIGTQMIAKGLHFPDVTLVGVVWADGGMNMPDYRASERTYQLISQVTGRAGRGDETGQVIIQTMRPDHYAICYAKAHDYNKLFEHEMRMRKSPCFPPYVRMTLLRIEGKVEEEVRAAAFEVAQFCKKQACCRTKDVELLGPVPAPLDKIRDHYRWQILTKSIKSHALHTLCSALLKAKKQLLSSGCRLIIDVDPENMM